MSDSVLIPVRLNGEPEISGPCLFFVNPGDSSYVLSEAKRHNAKRHFFFHSNLLELPGQPPIFWAGPAMGAPMAVFCLEKMIALGAKKIIVTGICGSLVKPLSIGDIIVPTWCQSEEGTSSHYPIDLKRPETDCILREDLTSFLLNEGLQILQGPVWTTDAPYRETKEKVGQYGRQGIMGVEMELSALATVAYFRNIQLAAAFLVSDELYSQNWQPGFRRKSFKQNRARLFHSLNKFIQQRG